jgi:uncharacterized protein YggU (UPF0235/DUF167 family)
MPINRNTLKECQPYEYHLMDDISFAIKNHGDGAVLSLDVITNAQEALFLVIYNAMLKCNVCSSVKHHMTNTKIIHLLSKPLKELPQDIRYSSSDTRREN